MEQFSENQKTEKKKEPLGDSFLMIVLSIGEINITVLKPPYRQQPPFPFPLRNGFEQQSVL